MKTTTKSDLYRVLPSVDELLQRAELAPLIAREGLPAVTDSVRVLLAQLRKHINEGHLSSPAAVNAAMDNMAGAIDQLLRKAMEFSLRPVINATGVILHTNLGRAPLAESALKRVMEG